MTRQDEVVGNAYFISNNLTYENGISREFRAAVKVFKEILNSYRSKFHGPTRRILDNLPKNDLDGFDYAFGVEELSFVEFCDIVSSSIFEILNKTIKTDKYKDLDFNHYNEWCDFIKHFDEKKFSKLFQKHLLTNNAVSYFVENGKKRLEIGCDERLFCFVNFFTSICKKSVFCENL